ncbi:MAG: hypothetical protein KDJ67_12450, partial [Nitratireductor sp.]|nr:hypothetical protein [Nitratireductor sp.]
MPPASHSQVDNSQAHSSSLRSSRSFGKRREPATITITRNGMTSHFRISPILFSIAFSIAAMFMVGYLGATAYLVFRDDLIGASHARNARLMHEYEDRIAALRSNLDRVTSRQLLDQQVIESKIAELVQRQEMLTGRDGKIGKLLDAAQKRGLEKFLPEGAPNSTTDAKTSATDPVRTGAIDDQASPLFADAGGLLLRGSTTPIKGMNNTRQPVAIALASSNPDINDTSEAV